MYSALSEFSISSLIIGWILLAAGEAQAVQPNASDKPKHWIPAPADDAPVVKLTATQFGDELAMNDKATLEKYAGKWLEITGVVESISARNPEGESQLMMPGHDLPAVRSLRDIDFKRLLGFNMSEPALWKTTSPGSKVTMRGVLARVPGGAGFDHSTIISPKKDPAPGVTASKLASDFAANSKACKTKYGGKALVVSGEFQEYDKLYERPVLKGSRGTGITVEFSGRNLSFQNLKAGDKLVVYGICDVDTSETASEKIKLRTAFRITE